ncbi:hypothetical protein ACJIZ3_006820 [Penstemon smallii]|uniref:GIR1-like zinc ribbon domain-containing protein n=1 Tax=Penstemon smallii TaxID=265156 RepID=A0ABD3S921_9LAMI
MAAEVGYLVRVMNGGDSNDSGKSTAPITRDLLGGCCTLDSKELDLDLQVPCGWEKRLDLKSGKVYLQKCNSSNSSSSTSENKAKTTSNTSANIQDLNFPPVSKPTLNLFNDSILDLKLVSSPSTTASPSSSNYQSVCTLDKVKSALERAEKETVRKRSISMSKSSSARSNSSSSIKDSDLDQEVEKSNTSSFAAGCPSCLFYVLTRTSNPKCPRCNSDVPLPVAAVAKKPRIDLNISI